jgi:hypothetical protein
LRSAADFVPNSARNLQRSKPEKAVFGIPSGRFDDPLSNFRDPLGDPLLLFLCAECLQSPESDIAHREVTLLRRWALV